MTRVFEKISKVHGIRRESFNCSRYELRLGLCYFIALIDQPIKCFYSLFFFLSLVILFAGSVIVYARLGMDLFLRQQTHQNHSRPESNLQLVTGKANARQQLSRLHFEISDAEE